MFLRSFTRTAIFTSTRRFPKNKLALRFSTKPQEESPEEDEKMAAMNREIKNKIEERLKEDLINQATSPENKASVILSDADADYSDLVRFDGRHLFQSVLVFRAKEKKSG